ncbi:MAG: sodium:proton antiporter [Hungatella sp.]|jgi:multicomponent Na+:H+ antiporter subunit F|nr:sodium:proton antiporter [Hungatella sp.]
MELIQQVYAAVMSVAVVALAVLIVISIVRSILGPGISDRIIAVNMIGTMVIMITAILSVMLNENYLADICLIYAMISFLGVVLFCKVYTGVYLQRKHMLADLKAIEDNLDKQAADHEGLQEEEVAR